MTETEKRDRDYPFGEGTMRIDAATTYMIKQARFAQKKWGLADAALDRVLERVVNSERSSSVHGTMRSRAALAAIRDREGGWE